jgi:site-specific DNA recombinase
VLCVTYCRISEDRTGQELGIARQLEDCRALAAARGWSVVQEFSDNDISALKGSRRPGYEALMAAVAAGQVDRIIVWHTSRLWRNRRERADGIERLRQARASVTSVKGMELDLTSASGRMIAGILGEFDTAESEVKGERVSAAARQRALQGRNHGSRRAYGYASNGLEIVPEEAALLRRAAEQVLAGVSLGAVTRWLNGIGARTVRGNAWASGTLRDALKLPRHAGLSVHRGEVVGRGQWPPIFDLDTHQALVTLLNDPARKTSTGNRAAYLLSGIATCGVCGGSISSAGVKGDGTGWYRYVYRCRINYCVGRRRDAVDEYVAEVIIARLSREDARELLVAEDRPDVAALRTEATTLRLRLDDLAEAFADGNLTRSQLVKASERIRLRLDAIEAATAHSSRAPVLADLVSAQDVRAAWQALPLDRRRAVVQALMAVRLLPGGGGRRPFDPSKVEITWLS